MCIYLLQGRYKSLHSHFKLVDYTYGSEQRAYMLIMEMCIMQSDNHTTKAIVPIKIRTQFFYGPVQFNLDNALLFRVS